MRCHLTPIQRSIGSNRKLDQLAPTRSFVRLYHLDYFRWYHGPRRGEKKACCWKGVFYLSLSFRGEAMRSERVKEEVSQSGVQNDGRHWHSYDRRGTYCCFSTCVPSEPLSQNTLKRPLPPRRPRFAASTQGNSLLLTCHRLSLYRFSDSSTRRFTIGCLSSIACITSLLCRSINPKTIQKWRPGLPKSQLFTLSSFSQPRINRRDLSGYKNTVLL